jgi:3-deoxy-7-phosphoheptulonate synthase
MRFRADQESHMLVVMSVDASSEQIEAVANRVRELGYTPHVIPGAIRTAIGITGNQGPEGRDALQVMPGVADVVRITAPYKLVSRETHPEPTSFPVAGTRVGKGFTLIAGPCSVENESMIMQSAEFLVQHGVRLMRGGAYKPRTSPYAFQGLGKEGLRLLAKARDQTGIGIVTEVMDADEAPRIEEVADILQIGTRNMQNYPLLRRLAKSSKPILLKRGMAATLEEWLMAAEYLASGGNRRIILCERGVRTFADQTRNTLDLSAIPVIKRLSHLPIFIDPSHGTGKAEYVPSMCLAALAAGADGLLIEVHPDPRHALSDGQQSLNFTALTNLCASLKPIAAAIGVEIL